ncbi:MAG: hypothetical protein DRP27_03680 [Thermotogae bacterium]|nr:MAG: hypothetical protein DRP27_03680 [Thermotogota bacterium]
MRQRILEIVQQSAEAAKQGREYLIVDGARMRRSIPLRRRNNCAGFIVAVYEAALGLVPGCWAFHVGPAQAMEKRLKWAGKEIPAEKRQPGDLVFFRRGDQCHVAIYMGRDDRGGDLIGHANRGHVCIQPMGALQYFASGWYRVVPA